MVMLAATTPLPAPILVPGPRGPLPGVCATVAAVPDADTVDCQPCGSTQLLRVRVTGVNAPELTDYGPDPQGDGAPAALWARQALAGQHVYLSSRNLVAVSGDRAKRYVEYLRPDGTWGDYGADLVRAGHALPLAQPLTDGDGPGEYDRNLRYAQLARRAAAAAVGIWGYRDPQYDLAVSVDWSGAEAVAILNRSKHEVDLSRWSVRDGMTRPGTLGRPGRGYEIPDGTRLPARRTLIVKVGPGSDTALVKHYQPGQLYIFDNPSPAPVWGNDGGYLCRPGGEMQAWQLYPDLSTAPQE